MGPALLAASIAAIVAALLSLPLRSPSDAVLNSATVVIGTLAVGVGAGLLWNSLGSSANRLRNFGIAMAAALGVVDERRVIDLLCAGGEIGAIYAALNRLGADPGPNLAARERRANLQAETVIMGASR